MLDRIAFMLLLALLTGRVGASEPDAGVPLEAEGIVEVAPDGVVQDFQLETALPEAVSGVIDRAVRGWRFEPVRVDGTPVRLTTRVQLELRAMPVGDGYALELEGVEFGVPRGMANAPPAYPREALREDIGAKVELVLQLDADGKVEDVHVEQVSLTKEPGKRTEAHRERFAAASVAAARDWTYALAEWHDGKPVMARLRVPVTFEPGRVLSLSDGDFIPGPVHPSPWPERERRVLAADPVGTRL